ncbi:MAG: NlpC/P60 family protein [Bacteroidota bacterium]
MKTLKMEFGICLNALIPLRAAPENKSEMTDQLLFGEAFEILEVNEKWSYIKRLTDEYEGWFSSRHFLQCSEDVISRLHASRRYILSRPFNLLKSDNNQLILPAGSILPFFNRENKTFRVGDQKYFLQETLEKNKQDKRKMIETTAWQFINAPYLWGGKTVFGIDCSGFTQILYRIAGIDIPRDSHQQVNLGETADFTAEAGTGDLAFFGNEEGRITHTGIILEADQIIHASGKVRVDTIDGQGIYNRETKRYTHKLKVVKRIMLEC